MGVGFWGAGPGSGAKGISSKKAHTPPDRKDKVKVLKAASEEESDDELGTIKVAKHGIKVKVADGYVSLLTLLPEGKKAMDGASYAAGHRLLDGQKAS